MCNASVNNNCIGRNHIPCGKASYTSTGCLLCQCMGSDRKEHSRGSESDDPYEESHRFLRFLGRVLQVPQLLTTCCHCGSTGQGIFLPKQPGKLGGSGAGETRRETVTAAGGIRVSGHVPFRYVCLYRDVSGNGKCLYPQYLGLGSGRFQKE